MEETTKIPADKKDFTYPSLIYERVKKEERLKPASSYFETDEDFNAAWEAIIGDNPSLIASLSHRKDEFLCSWKERNIEYRKDLVKRELELKIPTYSKSDEDFDVAWEAILVDNPSFTPPFSQHRDEFLRSWKQNNKCLREDMLTEELKMRTPSDSESDEDFNAAWEAICGDNPSLIASLSHCKDKFLRSWKQRNSVRVQSGYCMSAACLADGYIHSVVESVVTEGSELGSTTQSTRTVVAARSPPTIPRSLWIIVVNSMPFPKRKK